MTDLKPIRMKFIGVQLFSKKSGLSEGTIRKIESGSNVGSDKISVYLKLLNEISNDDYNCIILSK